MERTVSGPGLPTSRPRLLALALIVAAAPLGLFSLNRDWLLTPEGYLDPWQYVGFFHEYWNAAYSQNAYKLARLPWILSGALVTRALPPLTAAYTLHLAFFAAMTVSMFVAVYRLFRQPALAAVVALLLAFYTPAHGSGGWDYHNTAAGAFYVAALMVLVGDAALAGRRRALFAAGALVTLAVHTNITFVNFVPVLLFIHLRLMQIRADRIPSVRTLAERLAWGLAAGLLATALLCTIHWMAGRGFLFFGVLLDIVFRYVGDSSNQDTFRMDLGTYLVLPHLGGLFGVCAAGLALVLLRRRRAADTDRLAVSLVLQFIVMLAVWAGWQLAGQTALDWEYFAFVLIPSCVLAMAGLLAPRWPAACERHAVALALGTVVIMTAALGGWFETPYAWLDLGRFANVLVPFSATVFLVTFAIPYVRASLLGIGTFVVAFAAAIRIITPGAPLTYSAWDTCQTQPEIYTAIVETSRWLSARDPGNRILRIWFERDESLTLEGHCTLNLGHVGSAIAMVSAIQYASTPGNPMPAATDVPAEVVIPLVDTDMRLAIVTASDANLDAWTRVLDALDLTHTEVDRRTVAVDAASFTVHLWSVQSSVPGR